MKIAFSNDHAAVDMRPALLAHLIALGHEVVDRGAEGTTSVDYPDMAQAALRELIEGRVDRVILICGSGVGMSIAANRHPAVRCVLAIDPLTARMARAHNDANALALRARDQTLESNLQIIDEFLAGPFEGGRHDRRVAKLGSCFLSSLSSPTQPEVPLS
jgi:ribose 5-phosphate isomerase B